MCTVSEGCHNYSSSIPLVCKLTLELADHTTSRVVAELEKNVNVRSSLEERFAISVRVMCLVSSSFSSSGWLACTGIL